MAMHGPRGRGSEPPPCTAPNRVAPHTGRRVCAAPVQGFTEQKSSTLWTVSVGWDTKLEPLGGWRLNPHAIRTKVLLVADADADAKLGRGMTLDVRLLLVARHP